MTKWEVERLSKQSAKKLVQGTSPLKSWGTSGWYKSLRLNKYFHFRSMIEANVMRTLDEADDVVKDFATEQFIIPYQYFDGENAITFNYVPDFILKTTKGNTFVIEVKPTSQFQDKKNIAKWNTAKPWCWSRGVRFFVISEKDWPNLIQIINHFEDKNIAKAKSLLEWTF